MPRITKSKLKGTKSRARDINSTLTLILTNRYETNYPTGPRRIQRAGCLRIPIIVSLHAAASNRGSALAQCTPQQIQHHSTLAHPLTRAIVALKVFTSSARSF